MLIIKRYLTNELWRSLISVFTVLLLIAMSNKFVSLISKVSSGELAQGLLWKIMAFQLPYLCAFLLPFSLFLAVILSFGRAFVDNELTVLLACGFSWKQLLSIALRVSLIIMFITGVLNIVIVPYFNHRTETMVATQEPGLLADSLIQGRFYSFNNDKLIFYVNKLSPNKRELNQVFIVQQLQAPGVSTNAQEAAGRWAVLTAEKGAIKLNEKEGYAYLELDEGRRYEGVPGKQDYNIIHFGSYRRLIEKKNPPEGLYHARSKPTQKLLFSKDKSDVAELQWRLAVPLSAPILVLLACPLSWVSPRAGRYARLLPAIILFMLYYNGLEIAKRWVAQESVTPIIGLWGIHIIVLLLALSMNWVASGGAHAFFKRRKMNNLE